MMTVVFKACISPKFWGLVRFDASGAILSELILQRSDRPPELDATLALLQWLYGKDRDLQPCLHAGSYL